MQTCILRYSKIFYDQGHYKKSLSFYELFEKYYPSLSSNIKINKFICKKKIDLKNRANQNNNITLVIPVYDNKSYALKCASRISSAIPYDFKFDFIDGLAEHSFLLANINLSNSICKSIYSNIEFNKNLYNFLIGTNLFDVEFYKKQYNFKGTIKETILEYIKNGFDNGNLPAAWFDIYKNENKKISSLLNNIGKKQSFDTDKPAVSVIIPVYNNSHYLTQCIDSIIEQSLKCIEIIIINDGSTDQKAISILNNYAYKDKRIRLIHKKNTGYGHSMNCGLYAAKGEYISIVESDDYINLDMLNLLYNKAKKFNCDCVKGDTVNFYGSPNTRKEIYINSRKDQKEYNIIIDPQIKKSAFDFSITCCGIYRRTVIEQNEIRYSETPKASYQDITFNFIILCCIKSIMFIQYPVYYYRQDNDASSISNTGLIYMGYKQYIFVKNKILSMHDKNKFMPMLYYRMFNNFLYTKTRISKENINNFDIFFSKYFKYCVNKNNTNLHLFTEQELLKLHSIIHKKEKTFLQVFNVCFCSNDDYIKPMFCALESLINTVNKNKLYVIHILYFNINNINKKEILKLSKYNILINFVDCSYYKIINKAFHKKHYSKEMFLRFLIPELFVKYDKVLYLDCDLIIQHDVSEIFNTKTNKALAVVKNICNSYIKDYVISTLNIDCDKYFNSGVILFNIKNLNTENFSTKIFEIFPNYQDLEMPDQDLLNIYFKNNVFYLDMKWNFQWHNYVYEKYSEFSISQRQEYLDAAKNPYIIHYTTHIKPWNNKDLPFSINYLNYEQKCNVYLPKKYPISVIIPIFNAENTLKKSLESVLHQSILCEIICIDDGSTDKSSSILKQYSKKYKNIVTVYQNNIGSGLARNKGLSIASGEFVFFLDADDCCPNHDCLEKLYQSAKKTNTSICGGSLCFEIDGKVKIKDDSIFIFDQEKEEQYENVQYDYGYQRYIFNLDFLKMHNIKFPNLLRFQDPIFLVSAMHAAGSFYQIPYFSYCYTINNKVNWTIPKVYDLLQGLESNLIFSYENQLDKLFKTTKNRFYYEFSKIYNNFMDDDKIKNIVTKIKFLIDFYSPKLGKK